MKNITPFLAVSQIKPELAHIYVHDGYAVATDSFRLVEIKLDDFCTEHIPNGYYDPKKWVAMYKAYSKKTKDIHAFMSAIAENKVHEDMRKDYIYPDYKNIIPKLETLQPMDTSSKFNLDYLLDFLSMIEGNTIDLYKIKDNGHMFYYEADGIKILLMKQCK